jgi:tRNA threonylcarbamoyladenosine biosynthesis protein TsaE
MNTIFIENLKDIQTAAKSFLSCFSTPQLIAFYGEMGAGKTTFIKAVCSELGVIDTVNSPTFAIVNEYETNNGQIVYHFDLYRIEDTEELMDIGFEDYLYSKNWCFIEWPQIAEAYFPKTMVKVKIEELENGRRKIIF